MLRPALRVLAITLTLTLPAATAELAHGFSSGPPDGFAGDPPNNNNCTLCHTTFAPANSGIGSVSLSGLPASYDPGETYTLTIMVEDAEPNRMRWGFELTVINESDFLQGGDLATAGSDLIQISAGDGTLRDYLKHTSVGTFVGQTSGASWDFDWTAPDPATGDIHFWFAGNAANNGDGNQEDYIYTGDALLSPTAADAGYPLALETGIRAIPNPLPGEGALAFALSAATQLEVRVLDATGRLVRSLASGTFAQGEYAIDWDGRDERGVDVPAGVYFTLLKTPADVSSSRMVVVR